MKISGINHNYAMPNRAQNFKGVRVITNSYMYTSHVPGTDVIYCPFKDESDESIEKVITEEYGMYPDPSKDGRMSAFRKTVLGPTLPYEEGEWSKLSKDKKEVIKKAIKTIYKKED